MEFRNYFPNVTLICSFLLFEDKELTNVLDITDASFRGMLRTNCSQNRKLIEVSTDNGKIVIEPVTLPINGTDVTDTGITITLTGAETLAIYEQALGRPVVSDLEITFSSGTVRPKILELTLTPCVPETRNYDRLVKVYE